MRDAIDERRQLLQRVGLLLAIVVAVVDSLDASKIVVEKGSGFASGQSGHTLKGPRYSTLYFYVESGPEFRLRV
jgi:hypothetical protein